MIDATEIVRRYIDAWNERDAERRAKAVAALWTEDGGYTDPFADVTGHEGIAAVIAATQEQFPGHAFRLAGAVDAHHHIARFTWELVAEDGAEPLVVGSDVAVLDSSGRVRDVYGFLDKVPAEA